MHVCHFLLDAALVATYPYLNRASKVCCLCLVLKFPCPLITPLYMLLNLSISSQ